MMRIKPNAVNSLGRYGIELPDSQSPLDTIFAATWGYKVWRSVDNGNTWIQKSTGLTGNNAFSFARIGTKIFVAAAAAGVFVSTDNGENWTACNTGLSGGGLYVMAIHYHEATSTLFIGTSAGVKKSTNEGASWSATGDSTTSMACWSFTSIGSSIFSANPQGVKISTDNGTSWTQKNNGLTTVYSYFIRSVDTVLFVGTNGGGVFTSSDSGENWAVAGTNNTPLYCYAIHQGNNLYVSGSGGDYSGFDISEDNGATWERRISGLSAVDVQCIATASDNSIIFIGMGSDGGVYKSTNEGVNWIDTGSSPFNTYNIKGLIVL